MSLEITNPFASGTFNSKLFRIPVILTFFIGWAPEGTDDKAWLDLGFTTFQPSELLKICFIIWFVPVDDAPLINPTYKASNTFSIFSKKEPISYQINNAKENIFDGQIGGKDYVGMSSDSAISYEFSSMFFTSKGK